MFLFMCFLASSLTVFPPFLSPSSFLDRDYPHVSHLCLIVPVPIETPFALTSVQRSCPPPLPPAAAAVFDLLI